MSKVEIGKAGKTGVLDHPDTPKSSLRDSRPQFHFNVIQDLNLIIAKILEEGFKERKVQEYFKKVHDRKICVRVWIE